MQIPITPYLSVLRTQLATTLRPGDNESAQKVTLYSHRILTQLLLHAQLLPQLHEKALADLSGLLDDMSAALRNVEGGAAAIEELELHVRTAPDYPAAEPVVQKIIQLLTSSPGPVAGKLMQKTSAILLEMQNAIHAAAVNQEMQPLAAEDKEKEPLTGEQKKAFQVYLRDKFADPALEVGGVKSVLGGGSKQTLFMELKNADRLPATVVIRIDKADSPVGSTVADEFDIMKTMYESGLPVPQPFALEVDRSLVGASFMVVSRIDGHNIGDAFDVAEPTRKFGVTLAQAMAKLHQIPVDKAAGLAGAKVTTRERMQQNIAEFEGNWRKLGATSIALELAYHWLKTHMQFAEGRRSIVHRDIGCHNMLGKDGDLAALLDWETAVIGNPAQDLAYAYHTIIQLMPWEDFLAEYEKAGGTIPTQSEIDYYRLWRAVWIMGFQLLARSYFISGVTTEMILAYASQYWYQRSELTLQEMVSLVYERY